MPIPATCLSNEENQEAIALLPVGTRDDDTARSAWDGFGEMERTWLEASGFTGAPGQVCSLPSADGRIAQLVYGAPDDAEDIWAYARLHEALQPGHYRFAHNLADAALDAAATGWQVAAYRFDRYKASDAADKILHLPEGFDAGKSRRHAGAVALVRDMINTPAEDMGPADIEAEVAKLAQEINAEVRTVVGDALLSENFPAIHAVGRAAANGREPRLIEMTWGKEDAPLVAIVGKGVAFDTGGLNMKPATGMRLMKKDMGGAAHALGLAYMLANSGLDIRIKLLIPAVENAVDGNAFRPGDIIPTRAGLSVEIDNTDAEGRLILCDAVAYACETTPDLLVDFATLTGAARIALGPDLPATYVSDDSLWLALEEASHRAKDPLWRMPLWQRYDTLLDSSVADVCNVANTPMAGSVTAALFIQRFVEEKTPWIHFDIFGWCPSALPGRPVGGHAQAIFSMFSLIAKKLTP